MLTDFGKELKKLRVDHQERLIDMASRVGKSAAYISALEVGRKPPTGDIVSTITRVYQLCGAAADRLRMAADRAKEVFKLEATDPVARDTAALLARRFSSLSPDQLQKIQKIVNKKTER
jgi:HTH-type transcriptional regulator, competence development regulator